MSRRIKAWPHIRNTPLKKEPAHNMCGSVCQCRQRAHPDSPSPTLDTPNHERLLLRSDDRHACGGRVVQGARRGADSSASRASAIRPHKSARFRPRRADAGAACRPRGRRRWRGAQLELPARGGAAAVESTGIDSESVEGVRLEEAQAGPSARAALATREGLSSADYGQSEEVWRRSRL